MLEQQEQDSVLENASNMTTHNNMGEETSKSDIYDGTIPQLDSQAETKSSGLPPIEPIECEVKESYT